MTLRLLALGLVLASVAPACTPAAGSPRRPEAPAPEPVAHLQPPDTADFTGYASFSGRRLPVALTLVGPRKGADLTARLRIPALGLQAVGRGGWEHDRLGLELLYGDHCAGSVVLEARRDDRGRLSGSLEAVDCTGEALGSIDLARPRAARAPSTR